MACAFRSITRPLTSARHGVFSIASAFALAVLALAACGGAPEDAEVTDAAAPPSPEARTPHAHARLLAEQDAVVPGQPLTVLLALELEPGWHTYWRNPGDSGAATRLAWNLPPGFAASPIAWPRPERLPYPPLMNFGYKDRALHLVTLDVPANLEPGAAVTLATKANWLVCSDICIPESVDLALQLPVRAEAGASGEAEPLFAAAREQLPGPAPGIVQASADGAQLALAFDAGWNGVLGDAEEVAFFPYAEGAIEPAGTQALARAGDGGWRLVMPFGWLTSNSGLLAAAEAGTLGGVVVVRDATGATAYEVAATVSGS